MLNSMLTFVVGGAYNLYDRFGKWFLAALGLVAVLLSVTLMYCLGFVRAPGDVDRADAQRRVDEQARSEAAAENEAARKSAEAAAKKKAELAASQAKRAATMAAAAAARPAAPVSPAAKIAAPPPKPKRPENLVGWKKDDYLAACREGDPRLPEAIQRLAARFPDSDQAVKLYLNLLQEVSGGGRLANSPPAGAGSPGSTAIVDALAANRSKTARESLAALLGGSIRAADDRGVVTAVLRASAHRARPADEDLLLAAAVEKNSRDLPVTAAANGTAAAMSAGELQKAASELIRAGASADLRLRLAKRILQSGLSPSDRARLIECLKEPRPENLAAQALLFASAELEPAVAEKFQQHFTQCSSAALARLAGVPVERVVPSGAGHASPLAAVSDEEGWSPGGTPPALAVPSRFGDTLAKPLQLPDVDPMIVARTLWTQSFCEVVDQRLAQASSLSDSRGLVMLAATIPVPSTRSALKHVLERFWYEGPSPLAGMAFVDDFLPDPGLLLVLKSLPHHNVNLQTPDGSAPRKSHSSNGKSAKAAATRAVASETRDIKQKQDQIAVAWLQRSELLVRTLITRLHAVGLARKIDPHKPVDETAALPVSLEGQAEVVAAVAVDLPGEALATARSSVAPLRIRYWRVEAKARAAATVALCKRQLKDCEQRSMPYGVWFDGYLADRQSARTISTDVVVRKAVPDAPVAADQEQYLIVEVLSVESAADWTRAQSGPGVTDRAERARSATLFPAQLGVARQ